MLVALQMASDSLDIPRFRPVTFNVALQRKGKYLNLNRQFITKIEYQRIVLY
jgi:hypothetical protein